MSKEKRQYEKDERARLRNDRIRAAQERQRELDASVYGDSMLSSAQSSSKGDGRGGIWDVSTHTYEPTTGNKTDSNSRITEDGIDTISTNAGESISAFASESTGLGGVEILWADGDYTYIDRSLILENYENQDWWSIAFDVVDNAFDKNYDFDDTEAQWDDTGTDQTVYRLRVVTKNELGYPTPNSVYGQYRESIICRDGEPVTVLTKSS